MRVTIKELRRIIKEEYAKVLEENEISGNPDQPDTIKALTDISELLTADQRKQLASVFGHTINTAKSTMEKLESASDKRWEMPTEWPPEGTKEWTNQHQLITDIQVLDEENKKLKNALTEIGERFEKFENLIDPDRNEHAEVQKQLKKFQAQNIPLDDKRVQDWLANLSQ
jgi:predicted RNase H-like nuclease (RuvC/YqgF family)